MSNSRKYPHSPHRRDWNFLEFLEGRGSYKNSLPWGRYGYFLELHNIKFWWKEQDKYWIAHYFVKWYFWLNILTILFTKKCQHKTWYLPGEKKISSHTHKQDLGFSLKFATSNDIFIISYGNTPLPLPHPLPPGLACHRMHHLQQFDRNMWNV